MTAKDDELVLGLPRDAVPGGLHWRGVQPLPHAPLLAALERHGTYRRRGDVEDDPTWKQVIPYLALRDDGDIFLMRRSRAGGDVRLHDRYTIGVGGHVNPEDGDIIGGLRREWAEEMAAAFTPDFQAVGLLNDDDDAVGAVHLGMVFSADAKGRLVEVREIEKLEGNFAPLADVGDVVDLLETWSALLFDFLVDNSPNR